MESIFYADPITGDKYEFKHIPVLHLMNGSYQRDLSTGLTGKLAKSMTYGFFVPLLVVEQMVEGTLLYEVVDGQHRLAAIQKMAPGQDLKVPCIVLPPKFKNLPLIYNTEKADNIKDICTKFYQYYVDMVEEFGEQITEEAVSNAAMGLPYYITLAIALKEYGLKSPSLVEPVVKKLDTDFFKANIGDAYGYRQSMANMVSELEKAVEEACTKFNIFDANLKKAIVSKTQMEFWGRKSADVNYLDGMEKVINHIKNSNWGWMAGK